MLAVIYLEYYLFRILSVFHHNLWCCISQTQRGSLSIYKLPYSSSPCKFSILFCWFFCGLSRFLCSSCVFDAAKS